MKKTIKKNNIKLTALLTLTVFSFVVNACKGEKYKDYDAQQKAADEKQANESNKLEETKSFNINLIEGLLPIEATVDQDYYTKMKADETKEFFGKFNQLIETDPMEAAMYLTLATNPWVTKPEVTSASSGSKYLDKSLNLVSPLLPGNLFKLNGNRYHKLALSLGTNLVQAYILNSRDFTKDANFKLIMAGFLFLKKAELEMQVYRNALDKTKSDSNEINTSRFRTKRYLELGIVLIKYALTRDDSSASTLIYPVQFVNFNVPMSTGFTFDIFTKESDISMEELVLNPKSDDYLLNGAFNNLGYLTKDLDSLNSILAEDTDKVAMFDTIEVDVTKMTNRQILDTATAYLQHYKIKDAQVKP